MLCSILSLLSLNLDNDSDSLEIHPQIRISFERIICLNNLEKREKN